MSNLQEELPEWMLKLENKRKKQHRLAHEIGAGAPCFICNDRCPGLDLHFWRKVCRNCKCKKEDHDIKDDEGYEQFEILLGSGISKKRKSGVLKIKLSENITSPEVVLNDSSKGIPFDWLPSNVSEDVASEYMQQLPTSKLPISGSDGALYRRQQLTKQVPPHDLDAKHCHNLSSEEIKELVKYLENVKSNVFGQGFISKVSETRVQAGESQQLDKNGRLLINSQSLDTIRPLPPLLPVHNSVPRPFQTSSNTASGYEPYTGENTPLLFLPPRADLKTPSEFLPERHLEGEQLFDAGKVLEGMKGINLNQEANNYSEIKNEETVTKRPNFTPKQQEIIGIYTPAHDAVCMNANINFENSPPSSINSVQVSSQNSENSVISSDINKNGVEMNSGLLTNLNIANGIDNSRNAHHPNQLNSFAFSEPISSGRIAKSLEGGEEDCVGRHENMEKSSLDEATRVNSNRENDFNNQRPAYITQPNFTVLGINENMIASSLPIDGTKTSSILRPSIIQSCSVATDSFPKTAQMMQQHPVDPSVSTTTVPLCATTHGSITHNLDCHECELKLKAGDIAVFAERASNLAWHPSCFVCFTCKELLVDLMYFYCKNNVYCGRHYAEVLGIPRCFACDELIFVKEHTVAEGKVFHVKHFCCYECDDPLAGKQYISVEEQPVCLECYNQKYGKKCHNCKKTIAAGDQRICWKHLNWHVKDNCFCCFVCAKSLVGSRFSVKDDQPFCSKECIQKRLERYPVGL